MSQGDQGDKTEAPTAKRRADARRKGTVAKSQDLTGSLVMLAFTIVLPFVFRTSGMDFLFAFKRALFHLPSDITSYHMSGYLLNLLVPASKIVVPIMVVSVIAGLTINFSQVGFVFSGETLKPNLNKLNPMNGFKRLFSSRSIVEALKLILKSTLFGYVAWCVISDRWEEFIGFSELIPLAVASEVGNIIRIIAIRVALVWLIIAIFDYAYQKYQTEKSLKMTKDEVKREFREMDTAPELKQALSKKRAALLKGRMQNLVQDADVVVTNPEHYSVALKYDSSEMIAPMVVAKGQDYLALKIREIARKHDVPIVPSPPLARELYASCDVGDMVPRNLFQAVAEVLAYVYKILGKKK